MMPEPTYTLGEARKKLARLECEQHGHDWEIVTQLGREAPSAIVCARCGQAHEVVA